MYRDWIKITYPLFPQRDVDRLLYLYQSKVYPEFRFNYPTSDAWLN